jgi:hypothetical protein
VSRACDRNKWRPFAGKAPPEQSSLTLAAVGNGQQKTPSDWDGALERVKGIESDHNPADSSRNSAILDTGAAKASAAVLSPVAADGDLRLICEAWPTLPEAIRAGILAMIRVAR